MGLRTQKRRRRENRTDYKARRILLESGIPRIVVRRTNKYFILQAVESVEAQDRVVATITSKELLKHGWNSCEGNGSQVTGNRKRVGNLKSIPAGYLTGLLFAKQIKDLVAGSRSPVAGRYIMDLGMARTLKGSRVFAVVKGLIDGGLDINANEKVFPSEDRLMGEHTKIADVVLKCKETISGKGSNPK
ncbi:MAG: hypothetical protein KJ592_02100, partial [Nanoarchaeota archaeon]|nr:hypothetical protein [Nanoarchaeota archaeon]